MLTWFFTFFGIGAGIAVLIFLAGVVGVLAWFLWKVVAGTPAAWREAVERENAREAAKKQQG